MRSSPACRSSSADSRCVGGEQRIALKQDRFIQARARSGGAAAALAGARAVWAPRRHWRKPCCSTERADIAARALRPTRFKPQSRRCRLLPRGAMTRRCREALGAAGLASMAPVDRINLLADAWALTEANRNPPSAYFELADQLAGDDHRSVGRSGHPDLDPRVRTSARPAGPGCVCGLCAPGHCGRCSIASDGRRLDGEPADRALLRTRLIRHAGRFRR